MKILTPIPQALNKKNTTMKYRSSIISMTCKPNSNSTKSRLRPSCWKNAGKCTKSTRPSKSKRTTLKSRRLSSSNKRKRFANAISTFKKTSSVSAGSFKKTKPNRHAPTSVSTRNRRPDISKKPSFKKSRTKLRSSSSNPIC